MALHKQILLLFAAGHKMLNDVPVKELKAETEEMTAFFEQKISRDSEEDRRRQSLNR